MKTIFPILPIAGVLSALLFSVQPLSAETYRGKVSFRGNILIRGQFADLSIRSLEGIGLKDSEGNELKWRATGLASGLTMGSPLGTYKGKLRSASSLGLERDRDVLRRTFRVSGRTIRLKEGRIRLSRRIGPGAGTYRLRGKGKFTVKA